MVVPHPENVPMKRTCLVVAVLFVAVAHPAHAQTRREIVAGPVTITGNRISGSFRVKESRRTGIVSAGTGGACLVAERSDRACSSDDDCGDLRTHYHPGGAAYCLQPQGARPHGTCWVRPGADVDFCRKSPRAALPLGTRLETPQADPGVMAGGRGVRWRVHACLNGYDDALQGDNHACGDGASSNLMTSDGPPRKIH
jgi:hypothetical protein